MELDERLAARLQFMTRLYELTDGSRTQFVAMNDVIAELQYSSRDIASVVEYLAGEDLIDEVAGSVTITHLGVREVEQSLQNPRESTAHFPPAVNIVNVQSMIGSQIQQGTQFSEQHGEFVPADQLPSITEVVAALRADLAEIVLDDEDGAELEAELGTVEKQLESSRPKALTIRSSLQRASELLTKAAVVSGSAVELTNHIDKLHRILPGV